jgi:hypothetical protein
MRATWRISLGYILCLLAAPLLAAKEKTALDEVVVRPNSLPQNPNDHCMNP